MNQNFDENVRRQKFTQCWLTAEPSVSAYVFATISGFHDAEDLVQQIAQEAARRFEQYDSNRPFLGWVLWIARSRVIDSYRRRKRDHLVFSDDLLELLGQAIAERAPERSHRRGSPRTLSGRIARAVTTAAQSTLCRGTVVGPYCRIGWFDDRFCTRPANTNPQRRG